MLRPLSHPTSDTCSLPSSLPHPIKAPSSPWPSPPSSSLCHLPPPPAPCLLYTNTGAVPTPVRATSPQTGNHTAGDRAHVLLIGLSWGPVPVSSLTCLANDVILSLPPPFTADDLASLSAGGGGGEKKPPKGNFHRCHHQVSPPTSICPPVTTDNPPGSPSAHSRRGSSESPLLPNHPSLPPSPSCSLQHAGAPPVLRKPSADPAGATPVLCSRPAGTSTHLALVPPC